MTAQRPLAFYAYALGEVEGVTLPPTHSRTLQWLRELGLPVSAEVDVATGTEGLLAYYRRSARSATRWRTTSTASVYKLDRYDQQRAMGFRFRARRAGPSRTSIRRRKCRRWSSRSKSTSAAPVR
jgi:DNA ligase (NAD+)